MDLVSSYALQLIAMLLGCAILVVVICFIAFVMVMAGKAVDE